MTLALGSVLPRPLLSLSAQRVLVCMYVRTCVFVCAYTRVCLHVCMGLSLFACMCMDGCRSLAHCGSSCVTLAMRSAWPRPIQSYTTGSARAARPTAPPKYLADPVPWHASMHTCMSVCMHAYVYVCIHMRACARVRLSACVSSLSLSLSGSCLHTPWWWV
jgi:hypothetical protein